MDDLLGKGGAGGTEGGDSELDSFFEDLSTIDDLEVAQEAPKPAAAEPAAAPAAAPARPRPEAPARAPRRPRTPAQPGRLRKFVFYLVLLAVFGGGGYYVYTTYIAGEGKIPWPVIKLPQLPHAAKVPQPFVPPPPPPVIRERPALRPKQAPPKPTGPGFSIQAATCFFDSCVQAYKNLLEQQHLTVRVKERMSQSQSLEVYSQTGFASQDVAQEAAERVNLENRMEGHAYVIQEGTVFRLSMGEFQDLARANAVRDGLNQHYGGQIVFAQRVKTARYSLKALQAGYYPTRAEAEQAVERLRSVDRSLTGAFVVANAK
ncbi:MAG: SPOR domain-containing protein [SAR324 cluster bacterium]